MHVPWWKNYYSSPPSAVLRLHTVPTHFCCPLILISPPPPLLLPATLAHTRSPPISHPYIVLYYALPLAASAVCPPPIHAVAEPWAHSIPIPVHP